MIYHKKTQTTEKLYLCKRKHVLSFILVWIKCSFLDIQFALTPHKFGSGNKHILICKVWYECVSFAVFLSTNRKLCWTVWHMFDSPNAPKTIKCLIYLYLMSYPQKQTKVPKESTVYHRYLVFYGCISCCVIRLSLYMPSTDDIPNIRWKKKGKFFHQGSIIYHMIKWVWQQTFQWIFQQPPPEGKEERVQPCCFQLTKHKSCPIPSPSDIIQIHNVWLTCHTFYEALISPDPFSCRVSSSFSSGIFSDAASRHGPFSLGGQVWVINKVWVWLWHEKMLGKPTVRKYTEQPGLFIHWTWIVSERKISTQRWNNTLARAQVVPHIGS